MQNSKLVNILSTFSDAEWKNFEKFAGSAFFNRGRNYLPMLNLLKKFIPEFNSPKITHEKIYSKLFPGKQFKLTVIKSMMNGLTRLAEDFLIHASLSNNKPLKQRILNDVLIEKKAYDYFKKNLRASEKELSKTYTGSEDYFYHKVKFSSQCLKVNIEMNREYSDLSKLYLDVRRDLLTNFMYELLYLYCNFSQLQLKESRWGDMSFLEEILSYLEKNNFSNEPVLEIYYKLIKLEQTRENDYYFRLKTLLYANDSNISYRDKKTAYYTLYSFLGESINRNDYSIFPEMQHLTEIFIRQGFANNESGYMSDVFFRNNVTIYNIMKQYKESENFVHKNYKLLKPGLRTNTFNYCIGLIRLQSGFPMEALDLFSKITYEDTVMKLSVDNIKLIIFYELDYIENCYTLIDSINIYLRSNPGIRKIYSNPYLNFNKSVKKLLKLKDKPDKYELEVLKKKISAENAIISKNWLLKRIEEISKQHYL